MRAAHTLAAAAFLVLQMLALCWLFGPQGPDHETAIGWQFTFASVDVALFAVAVLRLAFVPSERYPHASNRAERAADKALIEISLDDGDWRRNAEEARSQLAALSAGAPEGPR